MKALAAFDGGHGAALYVGGNFHCAGAVRADWIAAWNGSTWTAAAPGLNIYVRALVVFDDGTGPALYAAGGYSVRKWDAVNWVRLGAGMDNFVWSLGVFDDGSGPGLYAGGEFTTAGGVPVKYIAKWDGKKWSPLGAGTSGVPLAMTVWDDGTGPALYVGGAFAAGGGKAVRYVAKWDGKEWSALADGLSGWVYALTVFDDGSGPALYAGGTFGKPSHQPPSGVARWDGERWSEVGAGMRTYGTGVRSLAVFDDGRGPALYAGGSFYLHATGPSTQLARWDGVTWEEVAGGVSGAAVYALTIWNDGTGAALYAGGEFTSAGGLGAHNVVKWDGTRWSTLGTGNGVDQAVAALRRLPDGPRDALYVGGALRVAGPVPARYVARWDGATWSALASGTDSMVSVFGLYDDGGGPSIYAGGRFSKAGGVSASRIAKWDGAAWSALGAGVSGGTQPMVFALEPFDAGAGLGLYVGGRFLTAGGLEAKCIARWDALGWSPVGGGVTGAPAGYEPDVSALVLFDDGTGPALYVGGLFSHAGGLKVNGIAKWDGLRWSGLGGGMSAKELAWVIALRVYDDGTGPALYAAGAFDTAGGVPAANIARWDGQRWSAVGGGLYSSAPGSSCYVFALAVYDDGTGPALYAGGHFDVAGGRPACNIAKWDGRAWSPLGTGIEWWWGVYAMEVFEDADGPALYVGGPFLIAGGRVSANIARWGPLVGMKYGDLNCDGLVNRDDVDPFVLALWGEPTYLATHPDCNWLNADCNRDGWVDFNDIDPFVKLLGGSD